MTRKEAREAAEVMLAYADGKKIEYSNFGKWYPSTGIPLFNWQGESNTYRIKPEEPTPTYRPFKDAEECWEEMQKHQPFGWLKKKNKKKNNGYSYMTFLNNSVDYKRVYKLCTFIDGTPFGKLEEK